MRAAGLAAIPALTGFSLPAGASVLTGGAPLTQGKASSKVDGFLTTERQTLFIFWSLEETGK